jgi:ubiquinone/menaquinone biosynthesis C-methylase UbiE
VSMRRNAALLFRCFATRSSQSVKVDAAHARSILDQFSKQAVPFSQAAGIADAVALTKIIACAGTNVHDTMLDVACGGGVVACAFAPHVKHVTGMDMTPSMLAHSRSLAASKGLSNLSWQQGDVMDLLRRTPTASYSLVLSRFAFHHFLTPLDVLREMRRVCAPKGRVVLVDTIASSDPVKAATFNRLGMVLLWLLMSSIRRVVWVKPSEFGLKLLCILMNRKTARSFARPCHAIG